MFSVTLSNVLVSLFFMVPGFILYKTKKIGTEHLPGVSAVMICIGTPCMVISAFLSLDYSLQTVWEMLIFFVASMIVQALFMAILFFILRKKFGESKARITPIAATLGNVGFFGLPIVRAMMPNNPEVACFSIMYCISMNILAYTVCVFCLTKDRKYMSVKPAILNPTMLGFVIALPIYLLGLRNYLPAALVSGIKTVGDMTTPLCMIILGIRLAAAPIGDVFRDPKVYLAAALKLIVFPLFCYGLILLLPVSDAMKLSMLILSGTPCAALILSLAEMHKTEQAFPANCIFVSVILCAVTLPLLTLIAT